MKNRLDMILFASAEFFFNPTEDFVEHILLT